MEPLPLYMSASSFALTFLFDRILKPMLCDKLKVVHPRYKPRGFLKEFLAMLQNPHGFNFLPA